MSGKTCPYCSEPLEEAYLYVRGIFSSLHVSGSPTVPWHSRFELQQLDLNALSETGTGSQAVIGALRCKSCGSISFQAQS